MRIFLVMALLCSTLTVAIGSRASEGPTPAPATPPIAAPEDKPYPGTLRLAVDTSDLDRRIYRIHETIPVPEGRSDFVLLYPKWLPGAHAPAGPIARFAGLEITAKGQPVHWERDVLDIYAFHVAIPSGTTSLDLDFEYLSAADLDSGGRPEVTPVLQIVEWNAALLYPAGYYSRQIPVEATLTLPAGWQFGTALEPEATAGVTTRFKTVSVETLVDSPVYAGRYTSRLDLDPSGATPVHLDLFADRADFLAIKPEQLAEYRALVQQAYKLFGGHHFDHYDFLLSLSDKLESQGTEHHRSSEDGGAPTAFIEWDKNPAGRDLLAHELTHSWNGKFRRPADLWTPNFNVPMRDSLLWVYEGQTQYWGQVLTARTGMWSKQQALDQLASVAAYFQILPGRAWRPLQDTTSDEIINPRRPMPWRSWQRFEDYYSEGLLVWLDVDTLIREQSHGQHSLDDFARRFFGIGGDSRVPVTYGFDDIVAALAAVQPYDWASFLRTRLDRLGVAPLDGIGRGGYRLVYTEDPGDYLTQVESQRKLVGLLYSIGVEIDSEGALSSVLWGGPAYRTGLVAGDKIIAVNGVAYDGETMKAAIRDTKTTSAPLELIVKDGARFRVVQLDYHGGARYPHLIRDPAQPARLDDILAARP